MSHSTLHRPISETVRVEAWFLRSKDQPPIQNGLWGIKWSRDQWRHVTQKGQTRDPNSLRAQYHENG